MCAIFGFIASKNAPGLNLRTLAAIARGNVQRGPHAFGFAWTDAAGRLRMFKRTGRLVDHVGDLAMARDARMLVGHLRWATHGDAGNNLNNHPHPADGGWIVHNGVVQNYGRLLSRRDYSPVTECDSEVLGLLIEDEVGTLAQRVGAAVGETDGNLAMLGLWNRPGQMIVARRGNPLHVATAAEGLYLATLPFGLPGRPEPLPDNRVTRLSVRAGKVLSTSIKLRAPAAAAVPAGLWSPEDDDDADESMYCGG